MKKRIIFLTVLALIITTISGIAGFDVKKVSAATNQFQRVNYVNAVVTATALNVRQGASKSYPVVCVLKKGQTVKVFGKLGNWYAVYEPKTGCVGAASATYLKQRTTGTPAATPKPAPAPGTGTTSPPANTSGVSQDEQTILNLVNKARSDAGAGPLSFDTTLLKVARLKAKDMVDNNYFSHQSPTYGSPFDMMKQFGVTFKSAGENIAGNATAEGAFRAWMGSPGHKQNIMNSGFNFTGIGVVSSPTYGKVFVQQFIGR